jgi:hypothetical protein
MKTVIDGCGKRLDSEHGICCGDHLNDIEDGEYYTVIPILCHDCWVKQKEKDEGNENT